MDEPPTERDPNSSAEGGLISSIEQFDGPIDCPNKRVPYMIGVNQTNARVMVFRPRCKMWSCPSCRRTNCFLWAYQANHGAHELYDAGKTMTFLTITSSNKITKEQSWWVAPKAWMKLQARIRRQYGEYQYFVVPEVQERGHVHFHGIFSVAIGERWLKDNAAACGFGFMDDAKEVWSEGGVTGYVLKYLKKNLGVEEIPKGTRRVRTSRAWPKCPPKERPPDWSFQLLPRKVSVDIAVRQYESLGYAVTVAGSRTAWLLLDIDSSS